ncbi:hypothetical protein COU80_04130 [Candidatus Peregrinibacteria bacterium CG10_big_fil_rev_8_21_14_0_10_55_24]|nr:MAG: hypothetical protein COU80_04130 [Candidatus Peregrinibacteria bacterium CG10_big_fil_rev_8_21_14_0_10_55_24]
MNGELQSAVAAIHEGCMRLNAGSTLEQVEFCRIVGSARDLLYQIAFDDGDVDENARTEILSVVDAALETMDDRTQTACIFVTNMHRASIANLTSPCSVFAQGPDGCR